MHPSQSRNLRIQLGTCLLLTLIAFSAFSYISNDTVQATVSTPDLVIKSIAVTSTQLGPGDITDIIVVIENQGTAIAQGFSVKLYVDPNDRPPTVETITTTQTFYGVELLPNTSFTWTRTGHIFGDVAAVGTSIMRQREIVDDSPLVVNYHLYAWVDPPWEDHVTESNEENNLAHLEIAQRPLITQIEPSSIPQGSLQLPVMLTTRNAQPLTGTLDADFGPGITVTAVTKVNDNQAMATINLGADATLGFRSVHLTTPLESLVGANLFQVTGSPEVLTVRPNQASLGTSLTVSVTTTNTHFLSNTTTVDFGPQVTVQHLQVYSPTQLVVALAVAPAAAIGPRTVTITTTNMITPHSLFTDGHQTDGRQAVSEVIQLVDGFHVTDAVDNVRLKGQVHLQGRPPGPGPAWSVPLMLEMTDLENRTLPPRRERVVTDDAGNFMVAGVPTGRYQMRIKGDHTLGSRIEEVALQSDTQTIFFGALLEGDIEHVRSNNQIGADDFGLLSGALGSCEGDADYLANADLDEADDCVTMRDAVLLAANYNQRGDRSYRTPERVPSVLPLPPQATARLTFSVTATSGLTMTRHMTVEQNQTTTLPLYVHTDAENPVLAMTVHYTFTPALLQVTGVDLSGAPPALLMDMAIDNQTGTLQFRLVLEPDAAIHALQQIATIHIRCKAAGTSAILSPVYGGAAPTDLLGANGSVLVHAEVLNLNSSAASLGTSENTIYLPLVAR